MAPAIPTSDATSEDSKPKAHLQSPRFNVIWEIDVEDADDPLSAARIAQACQQRAGTLATVFSVHDRETGTVSVIDLAEDETPAQLSPSRALN